MVFENCFRDNRMNKKCENLVERIAEKGSVSIRKISKDKKEKEGFYTLINSNKFNKEKIVKQYGEESNINNIEGKHVLAIQDTTEINYSRHKGRIKENSGIGELRNGIGFFLHPVLAITADEEDIVGIPYIYHWSREQSAEERRENRLRRKSLPIEEKESYRWVASAQEAKKTLERAKEITFISDRESDIYEEFCQIPDEKTNLIIRSRDNRSIEEGKGKLFEYLAEQEVRGRYKIEIREKINNKSIKREAILEVRYASVTIKRPGKFNESSKYPETKRLNAIEVKEIKETIPEASEGVYWRLLTTHKVEGFLDAVKIVDWYKSRWYIEQLFRILKKKGFDVESSEFESGESLKNLVLLAVPSALKVMLLLLARDGMTNQKSRSIFSEEELECLEDLNKEYEGKLQSQKNPYRKESLSWVSWIIARMGGWKGLKSERPPGPMTFYQGIEDFERIFFGWRLFRLRKHGTP